MQMTCWNFGLLKTTHGDHWIISLQKWKEKTNQK